MNHIMLSIFFILPKAITDWKMHLKHGQNPSINVFENHKNTKKYFKNQKVSGTPKKSVITILLYHFMSREDYIDGLCN